jgi:hypothetical protein
MTETQLHKDSGSVIWFPYAAGVTKRLYGLNWLDEIDP